VGLGGNYYLTERTDIDQGPQVAASRMRLCISANTHGMCGEERGAGALGVLPCLGVTLTGRSALEWCGGLAADAVVLAVQLAVYCRG